MPVISSLNSKAVAAACSFALLAAGCQQKMAAQPSFGEYSACRFFENGTSAQQLPPGTVARGHLRTDSALFAGRVPPGDRPIGAAHAARQGVLAAEAFQFEGVVKEFPLPVTRQIVEYGRDRYMIYCVVCHDPLGTGFGKIVERGYTRPPSYHVERLRQAPVGHLFRVVSEGYGSMPSYAAQIPARDRWAIVAYVKALQLSQHFPEDELPEKLREQLRPTEKRLAGG